MKFSFLLIILLSFFSHLPAAAQTVRGAGVKAKNAPPSERRLALVIGNSKYENTTPLANPANDAADMAQSLKELGFEVISGTDQTLPQMRKLIREFGARLQERKGIGLFYYAGHGIQFAGKNFLIPVDAVIESEVETEDAGIDLNTVLRQMDAAGNGFNMVILDACRNNPFARSWRGVRGAGGLARVDAPTGTIIAYSTKPGDVASDGAGRNGLYTSVLLRQMRVKSLEMGKMLQRVRAEVIAQSKGKQVPFDESSVVGDFYFAGLEADPATSGNPSFAAAAAPADIERDAFAAIQNSTDPNDIRSVLEEYPDGKYSAGARIRLDRLVWESVKDSHDRERLQKYLDEFGSGQYAGIARIELRKISANNFADADKFTVFQETDGKYGFKTPDGRVAVKPLYDFVYYFSEGLAVVRIGQKYGYIDPSGTIVIPLKYDNAQFFTNGKAKVTLDGREFYINKSDHEIVN